MPKLVVLTNAGEFVAEVGWYTTQPKRGMHSRYGMLGNDLQDALSEAMRREEVEAQRAEFERLKASV